MTTTSSLVDERERERERAKSTHINVVHSYYVSGDESERRFRRRRKGERELIVSLKQPSKERNYQRRETKEQDTMTSTPLLVDERARQKPLQRRIQKQIACCLYETAEQRERLKKEPKKKKKTKYKRQSYRCIDLCVMYRFESSLFRKLTTAHK